MYLMLTKALLNALKKDQAYQSWKEKFRQYVFSRERLTTQTRYYLVYDIDDSKYTIKSEHTVTYNQIVLQQALVPSKKEDKIDILINDYQY